MRYLVSQVEQWGAEIDAMPAPDPGRRKVGKKEAIVLLARKLQAAARRGFSRAELREALSAMGLKVHVDTLRSALRDAGQLPEKRSRRTRRSSGELEGMGAESHRKTERHAARDGNGNADRTATSPTAAVPRMTGGEVIEEIKTGRPERLPTVDGGDSISRTALRHVVAVPGDQDLAGRTPVANTRIDQSRRPSRDVALESTAEGKSEPLGTTSSPRPGPRPSSSPKGTFIPREDSDEL